MRVALLALLAIVPYLPAMSGDFVWDDRLHIAGNPHVETLSAALASIGRPEGVYHRPLVFVSYAAQKALSGDSAFAFHLFNLLVHALNTVLLFVAARRSTAGGDAEVPFVAAAIFALHPLQSEAVAYISGRTDLMMTTAALLAWLAIVPGAASVGTWRRASDENVRWWQGPWRAPLRGAWRRAATPVLSVRNDRSDASHRMRRGAARSTVGAPSAMSSQVRRGAVAALATAAAIASKESGYALVLLLPWLAWRHSEAPGDRVALVAPSVLVAAILFLLRPVSLPGGGGSPLEVLVRVGVTLESYLRLLVWPASLQVDRLVPVSDGGAGAVFAVAVAVAVAGIAVAALRAGAPVADWAMWSLAFYLPVSNARAIYPDIAGRALFAPEHNLYAPLAGIGVLVALGAARLLRGMPPLPRRAVAALGAVVLLAWGAETWARGADWRDEMTLFHAAAAAGSPSPRVWFNLGNGYLAGGRIAEAVSVYEQATRLAPADARIWANLGVARQKQGALAEAAAAYERSLALAPDALVYRNLAGLELARGDGAAAERALAAAAAAQARVRSETR